MIRVDVFRGRVPKISPKRLNATNAQVATNCDLRNGQLKPMRGSLLKHTVPKPGTLKTLFKYGANWLAWTIDVDVVHSDAPNSDSRILFTGEGSPKQTNLTMATAGVESGWPTNTYPWGITPPSTALSIQMGTPPGNPILRSPSWLYTLVTTWGEESAPSPITATTDVEDGQTVTLNGFAVPPGYVDYVTHYRVYRLNAGDYGTVYQQIPYLGDINNPDMPVAQTSFLDNIDDLMSRVLPTEGWLPPPPGLSGVIKYGNSNIAGFVGNEVYQCEPGYPFAFPTDYIINSDTPVVGLGYYDDTLVITNQGKPLTSSGKDPSSALPGRIEEEQPNLSKRGIVSTKYGVIYPSYDGFYMIGSGLSQVITNQLYRKDQWNTLSLAGLMGVFHDDRYYAFFEDESAGFYIDLTKMDQVIDFTLDYPVKDVVADGENIYLLLDVAGTYKVYQFEAGTDQSYAWRSPKVSVSRPIVYSTARVQGDFSGGKTAEMKFYSDGVLKDTTTVAESGVFRIDTGKDRTREYGEVELAGTAHIDEVAVSSSTREVTRV